MALIMRSICSKLAVVAASLACMGVSHASDWSVSLGGSVLNAPAFKGSDDYQLFLVPSVEVSYKDIVRLSPLDGLSAQFVQAGGFSSRVHLSYDGGRRENNNSNLRIAGSRSRALKGLGNIDGTAVIGVSAHYQFAPMVASLQLSQATSSHKGLTIDGRLAYNTQIEGAGHLVVGGRIEWADSDYNDAYFGINATQSQRSGLAQYKASSGLVSVGIFGVYSHPINANWSWVSLANYDRLQSDAADSPLVKTRGSANQFVLGTGLRYTF